MSAVPAFASAAQQLAAATASMNAWVEVDLAAVDHNVAELRAVVGPGVELIAVVKANAYGAGIDGVAPALERAAVDRFAVVWVAEALALRALGIRRPIIVLGHAFAADAEAAVSGDITLTCDSLELGQALSRSAIRQERVARVHLNIDSGLHRDGVSPGEAVQLANALRMLPGVEVEGLSTHMANADEADDSFSDAQHAAFEAALGQLSWVPYRHVANSATAIRRGPFRHTGVRVGLALHGILPENTPGPELQPVVSLKARLARVMDVAAGEGVSYGLTWRAERPSRVGLVPVGYADGWRRSLGNQGAVLVRGQRAPMVGRVCMDMFLVDVTGIPGASLGDEAVLIGEQGGERITAEEIAAQTGTIPWDVQAALAARLPRLFHRGGVLEG